MGLVKFEANLSKDQFGKFSDFLVWLKNDQNFNDGSDKVNKNVVKTKVIELDCITDGEVLNIVEGDFESTPCPSIQSQMKEILEANPNYKFVDLVYHQTNYINMEYASLIVKEI